MTPEQLKEKYMSGDFRLKGEFNGSDEAREETLTRCERYAGWTLPNIFPDDPLQEYDEMQNDYQSVGAQATTHLANKIMLALFQPSRPFFRMQLDAKQREELQTSGGFSPAQIDTVLSETERKAMRELDKMGARVGMTQAVLQLIITGNSLLYIPKNDDKMQTYSLRDYVCKRDLAGNLIKLIIKETKSVSGLGDNLQGRALEHGYAEDQDVSIYTCVVKTSKNRFMVWQELEAICYCQEQVGYYNKADLPWIPLTWNLARNKDYGTGLVENYSGDFWSLSTFAEAILDYSVLLTDVKNLVNPAGMTDAREVSQAASGAYVSGREEDIYVHSPQVNNNAAFLENQFKAVERRIGAAFLLNTAVTRDAERVTAAEIRMQAQELEGSMGGVYSNLAAELQLPLARHLLKKVGDAFKNIEPIVVTGLESLSRSSELDRMRYFFEDLAGLTTLPDLVLERLDMGNLLATLGAGHGVDYKKFLKDEAQVKEAREERMQQNAQAEAMAAKGIEQGKQQGAAQ